MLETAKRRTRIVEGPNLKTLLKNIENRRRRSRRLLSWSDRPPLISTKNGKRKRKGKASKGLTPSGPYDDDLRWILSEKSYLNVGEFIVDKQEHTIGLGSSCDVLVAWSSKHHTKVAIKRIRAFLLDDKKFAKRLAREIRIWASLSHDNVLPLLGYFIEAKKKLPNLVSKWMVNGSLFAYMKTFPRCSFSTCKMVESLDIDLFCKILTTDFKLHGISSGLVYLHSVDVVHADLKTQNILISLDDTPLLADFGLSRVLSESETATTTGSAKGSLRWMAPELFACAFGEDPPRHNKTMDIWAFGMVAYELLSWEIPYYEKQGDFLVMLAIMRGTLPAHADMDETCNPHVTNWIWRCCEACWRRDRTSRPTALQLEYLWSAASSLKYDEETITEGDSQALLRSDCIWPIWASELQNAFTAIEVAACSSVPYDVDPFGPQYLPSSSYPQRYLQFSDPSDPWNSSSTTSTFAYGLNHPTPLSGSDGLSRFSNRESLWGQSTSSMYPFSFLPGVNSTLVGQNDTVFRAQSDRQTENENGRAMPSNGEVALPVVDSSHDPLQSSLQDHTYWNSLYASPMSVAPLGSDSARKP